MKWLFPTLLTLFVVLFRWAGIEYPALLNVTPLFALFLCFREDLKNYLYIPLLGYLISDIGMNTYYGYSTSWSHLLLISSILIGVYLFARIQKIGLLAKTFVVTTAFFILTSTISWAVDPTYGSSWSAWANAIVFGHPEYPAAYLFYINSLIGNIGFTFLFDKMTNYQLSQEHGNSLHLLS